MRTLELAALAIALAVDAFAVAIAIGAHLKDVRFRQFFRLSWHFGLFQALMPIIGWAAGRSVRTAIEAWDHWIAFGLLGAVGVRMIKEALGDGEGTIRSDPTRGFSLVLLSVATSIDALAVGLSMSLIGVSVWFPALLIGVVACLFTAAGLQLGRTVGRATSLSRHAGVIGGLLLIAIGLNILREHGVLSFFLWSDP